MRVWLIMFELRLMEAAMIDEKALEAACVAFLTKFGDPAAEPLDYVNEVRAAITAYEAAKSAKPAAEPVVYRYRFSDPISGNPIWRFSPNEWNGQKPSASEPLYAAPQPKAPVVTDEKSHWQAWARKRLDIQTKYWMRAAKSALAGDMRELRNRVELIEAGPLDVVLSDAIIAAFPSRSTKGASDEHG